MLAMEITSFVSGSRVTALGGTGAGVGADTLSLQAASAKARRIRDGTRIGPRKIAEARPDGKEARRAHPAGHPIRLPPAHPLQQIPHPSFRRCRVPPER